MSTSNIHASYVLDTETTGFDPEDGDKIVEIGVVELDENRKPTGRIFHEYVDPLREVPEGAVRVHGNTRQNLIEQGGGQTFKDVAKKLQDFVRGGTIIIHNADFDVKFLNAEFKLCGLPPIDMSNVFCTLKYARVKHAGQRVSLDALCRKYGIDNSTRTLHGALLDAEILSEVYVAMTREQKTLNFVVEEKTQDLKRLVEKMPSVVVLPVVESLSQEDIEHERFMKRIAKESGGNSLWR